MKKIALGLLVASAALGVAGCKPAEEPAPADTTAASDAAPAADESAAADTASDMATDEASGVPKADDNNNPNGPSAD